MKKAAKSQGQSAAELISKRIAELRDWRGKTLGRVDESAFKALVRQAVQIRKVEMTARSLVVSSFLAAGCAGSYAQPDASEPHALLRAVKGESGMVFGGAQGISAYENAQCADTARGGSVAAFSWATSDEKTIRIKADERLYLSAVTMGYSNLGQSMAGSPQDVCPSLVSFVPEPAHTYQVAHEAGAEGCSVRLVDVGSGLPPASLQIHRPCSM